MACPLAMASSVTVTLLTSLLHVSQLLSSTENATFTSYETKKCGYLSLFACEILHKVVEIENLALNGVH